MSFLENGTNVKDAKNEKYISHTSHLPDERGGAGRPLVPTMERNGQEASDVKHTSHKSHLSHALHVTQRGSAENIMALLSGNTGRRCFPGTLGTPPLGTPPPGTPISRLRGGSWADRPFRATSAFRLSYPKWQKVYNVGFRVICPAK